MNVKRDCLVLVLAALSVSTAGAQAPAASSWSAAVRQLRDHRSILPTRVPRAFATIMTESEPNDNVGTADSVALGDLAMGVVNPAGDVDTWFVDLTAGEFFGADVDAESIGSLLDATLVLIAPDGETVLAANDDFDGLDSRVSHRVATTGRYYLVLGAFGGSGTPNSPYAINVRTFTCDAVGTELEPNDDPAGATLVAVEASGSGEICPADSNPGGDVDYWAFTAQAGTTIELDVDVAELGVLADPFVALFAADGTTRLAFNDNQDGADSRLQFSITTTGTYYAAVSAIAHLDGNPFRYFLHVRTTAAGPGDPIVVRAENLGVPLGMAVGSAGDLFVSDVTGDRILRIGADGVRVFATGITGPLGLAFDASGQLLVAALDGVVYRLNAQGEVARFITDAPLPFWIAVAPDGHIWLTDLSDRSLRRYGPTGRFEATFDGIVLGGSGPGPLAIGPGGEPYVSSGTDIWKLAGGEFQLVLSDAVILWAFAFDVNGNLYVPAPTVGRIRLYGPGELVTDPFAVGTDAPQAVAFARDASGATVARMFATEPRIGRVIEVNSAGVEHAGLPVGFVTPRFSLDAAAASLLGAGDLSATDLEQLDALGNQNGRFDVGDFQAYFRATGTRPRASSRPHRVGNR